MKRKKYCSNCSNCIPISVNKDMLCKIRGAVSSDYVCSRHTFKPELKFQKDKKLKCIGCENFIFKTGTQDTQSELGLCRLFSVRYYDGRVKNACSKYIKRRESNVS